jgi:RHS repeat-associated protein
LLLAAETALVAADSGAAFAAESMKTTAAAKSASSRTKHTLGPAQAQDEASAVLMARLQKREIEVLSERTAASTTYALPSGEMRTEAYAGPVRVKQDDGTWKDVNTTLSDTGSDLTPGATTADITVSDGGDSRLASVTKGKESFGLGWSAKLPTPTVKKNTASYALGSGQTLSVSALAQGFSENIKLTQQPDGDKVTYRIPMNLNGLKLSQAKSGHLLLKNAAGTLVAEAPAPMMWDASKDPASGESANAARVATKVETAKDGSQTLVLTPDAHFLATAQYPVTVDPTTTLAVTTDTWLQTPDYTDSQVSSEELKSGTYDSGTDLARAYLKFDVSKFTGKHVTAATMSLYNYYSATCSTSGAPTDARRITTSWSSTSVTWATRPSSTGTGAATNTGHWGYSSACPAAWSSWNLQTITQAWADGTANYGVMVYGEDETDSTTWRRFRSANYSTSGYAPKLVVTYNSYATTSSLAISPSAVNAYSGKRYVTTYTPTLSAKVTDADGSTVKGQFEITNDPSYTSEASYSSTVTSASVASGGSAKVTLTTSNQLPAQHLRMRVRGYDGTDYGAWSSYIYFVPNVAKPVAPTVVCDTYAQDTWTAKASGAVTCTLDTTSTDGQGFYWGLDDSTTPKSVYDTADGNGGDPLTISITPGDGWHTLYAKTIDSGGNLSTSTTAYNFGVGADGAGLLTPGNGDSTARRVSLTSTGKTTYTGVTYQYRRGETDTWTNVPVAQVTKTSDGTAVASWPVTVTSGAPAPLTWNVTSSLSADGPIDIRAAFTDGTTTGYSQSNTVTIDRNAGTAPSQSVGPGQVNTLTGDLTLSSTDVSAFGMSVSRTASSRRPTAGSDATGQTAIFGPQWTSGVSAELTDSDWSYVKQTSTTSVALVDVDGDETGFTATSAGGWKPEPGAEDLTLTGTLSTTFALKDDQGTTTTFVKAGTTATTWQMSTSYLPTDNSTTKVVSELAPGSTTLARPTYLIAPTSAVSQSTCQTTPATAGCRVLEFVYSTSTTATSTSYGEYAGTVKLIKEWSTEPGASAATSKVVERYQYDNSGRLAGAWQYAVDAATYTAYTYDSAGRIATYADPGQLAWTFTYGTAGNAATAGAGMLLSASRKNLTQGTASTLDGTTATTTVVYDVPLSGTSAPNAMGTSDVATLGQTDVPTDATAVFPADSVPTSNTGSDLAASAYARATITYTDASGREVNTASPGGHITTTEYDRFGNTVRNLTASNRELALATSGDQLTELTELGIDGLSTADRAQQLSTSSLYSSDGLRETDEYGPLHQVTLASALAAGSGGTDLPAGTVIPARSHTANTFDENRPTDGTATVANQITTTKSGAYVDGYPSDGDVRTSTTAYDWVKGLPTTQVTDPSGLAITTTTSYDSQGRVIKTTQPNSSGTDADTTVTTYYSATGTGTCNGRPEWADQVCTTGPAGAITGGGTNPTQLPTKTIQYNWWGNAAIVTETANSVTRTTTTTYDSYDRVSTVAVSGGVGTAVPDTTTTYDTTYGTVATVATSAGTISYGYDKLGRQISYSDGAGNTTTTAYDNLGRPVKTTDSAPSTTTYTYDTTIDPRGLETSRTDSVAGTFSATYDADGDLATEALPGGYTLTDTQDETGTETSRVYTQDSDGTVVASDTADHTVQDQTVADTDTNGQTRSRSYTYDAAGRLTQADDTSADSSCTRRSYTFDNNTNRTALATSTSDVSSACTSTGATTTSYTYDTADRLQASGTVYDAFGRTTTQASGATIGYYANDLARTQTSGTNRQTWTLDAAGRLAAWTTESDSTGTWTQTASKTNHYGGDGDSPDWTQETSSTLTRNVQGNSGDLDATTSATGGTVLQLTDIHGDTTVQLPLDTSVAPTAQSYDEYGNPEDSTPATRYGWLGGKQRSSETVTGAILMGVRLYDPTTGRFLSVDPVPGGSSNAYDYCNGDPVDHFDLDGRWWGRRTFWNAVGFFSYRSWIDSAGAASHGHYRKAWHYASGGTGSVTAGAAHSKFCSWYCRTVKHAKRSMWGRFGRFGARTFGWQVSVIATGLDYWHTRGPVTSYSHTYYAPGYRYRRYYGGRVI